MKPPAFQLYADDFLAGTVDMTAEEVGAYIRLLCVQWTRGGLVNDPKRLVMVTGCNEATTNHALTKFEPGEDGLLRNKRMEAVRATSEEWRAKSKAGGKASGRSRVGDTEWAKKMVSKRSNNEPPNEPSNETTSEPTTNSPVSSLQSPSTNPPNPLSPPAGDLVLVEPSEPPAPRPSALQVRIGRLLHRRPTTRWSADELKALRAIGNPDEEDLQSLEAYYSARIPADQDYRRTTILVLLRKFPGELDRARNFKAPSCF